MPNTYEIRQMTKPQLELALSWAKLEGWNPGLHDVNSFYAADPNGFFMGFLNGEPISSISVVKYGPDFGFLGLYIVKPEFRGQGYGLQIWKAGLTYLKGRTVGLDGVVAQQHNYKKSGFILHCRNIRFQGTGRGKGDYHAPDILTKKSLDPHELMKLDRECFQFKRNAFFNAWFHEQDHQLFAVKTDEEIEGFCCIRPCIKGFKIGPLFAKTSKTAKKLLNTCFEWVKAGEPVFLDVPEPNLEALKLAKEFEMHQEFETARMYLGNAPDLPINEIFGVTTFELG